MILHGRNIIVSANGVAIASARSCEFTTTADTEEKSSPMNGMWKEYFVMRKGWSLSLSYLVIAVRGLINVGDTYTLTIADRNDPNDVRTGVAICVENTITATIGNLCQGSWKFIGSGVIG